MQLLEGMWHIHHILSSIIHTRKDEIACGAVCVRWTFELRAWRGECTTTTLGV
jgi:hypothetical protein